MHLFTYGTLMFPEIWERVVGKTFDARPAMLSGFARYRVRGALFPVMVPADADSSVAGLAYLDVDGATLALLDEHESSFYDRVTVEPHTDDGRSLACHAYVLRAAHRNTASDQPWTPEWFRREAMAEYICRLDPGPPSPT